jgi:hypothetical protein
MKNLVFLKLGGSLITDKNKPYTSRPDKFTQIAHEIKSALSRNPDLQLILGHGPGSFGHFAVKDHAPFLLSPTFQGNWWEKDDGWRGFSDRKNIASRVRERGIS